MIKTLNMGWLTYSNSYSKYRMANAERMKVTTPSAGEAELVTLARKGKRDAYGELVRLHQSAVYNVAFRLTGDREDALDLTQDAFVRAFAALASFDQSRPFGPWINRIVTNLALNLLQKRRPISLTQSDVGEGEEEWELPDFKADPEKIYLASENQALLREALLSLPPQYRAVIELRHFQDCSYEEIAVILAITPTDVKSHLFRARRLLRIGLEGKR